MTYAVNASEHTAISFLLAWSVFGALHAIAWNYDFPTGTEKILWRVSSLVLAGGPVVFGVGIMLWGISGELTNIMVALSFVYGIICRLLLVSLMLASLRSLPSSAYQTIPWTNYIPHL